MDKKEFYKQLMTEYTFDEERIRKNAKRQSSGTRARRSNLWLPLATSAAVFVTAFGGILLASTNNQRAVQDSISAPASVSPTERILEMQYSYVLDLNNEPTNEKRTYYLSFTEKMTIRELDLLLNYYSDTGNIEIMALYDPEQNQLVKSDMQSEALYTGAKISAPDSLARELKECPSFAIEPATKVDDSTFRPLTPDELKMVVTNVTTTTPPPSSETQVSTTQSPPVTDTTTEPMETTPTEYSSNETHSDGMPIDTLDNMEEIPNMPDAENDLPEIDDETEYPLESILLNIPVQQAHTVKFINENSFIALSDQKIMLYRIISEPQRDVQLVSEIDAAFPKLKYTDLASKTFVIISNGQSMERSKLFIASGLDNDLKEVELSLAPDESITYAFCNGQQVIIKTQTPVTHSIYRAKPTNGTYMVSALEQYQVDTTILSFNNKNFIYAFRGPDLKLFRFDYLNYITDPIATEVTGRVEFYRSKDLTNFAMINEGQAYIYNVSLKQWTEPITADSIVFHENNSSMFTDGTNYYQLDGSNIVPVSEETYLSSGFALQMSTAYAVNEITDDVVTILVK